MVPQELPPVWVVTDTHIHPDPVRALASAPVECAVIVRDKHLPYRQRVDLAAAFVAQGRPTVVAITGAAEADRDRWPAGVRGFQVPAKCLVDPVIHQAAAALRSLWWGGSTHDPVELAHAAWCDYVTFSPVFASLSKAGYTPAFTGEQLRTMLRSHRRVLALGGVTPQNVTSVQRLGVHGVVLLGAVWFAADPAQVLEQVFSDFRGVESR